MNQNINEINKDELNIKDILKVLNNYKWLIMLVTFLFLLLSTIYLFFTPLTYTSHAIIEVKDYDKNSRLSDDLLQNAFYTTNKEIDKEIEILKTFKVNQKVIDETNLTTQLFIKNKYKKTEIYRNLPIIIKNVNVTDNNILNKSIKFIPEENGFRLELENVNLLLKKDIFLDNQRKFSYNKIVKTDYFEFSIQKVRELNKPIYFILNGDNRSIYENIVNKKLKVKQVNKNAPLIWISYEDNIPQRATSYVNKLVDNFLKEGLDSKSTRNNNILNFIQKQLRQTKIKLDASEQQLQDYKIKNKINNISTQVNLTIDKLSDIEIKISENKLNNELINNISNTIKNNKHIDSIGPLLNALGDTIITSYLNSLQTLKLKENELNAEYTSEYPKLITVRQQITSIKEKIILNIRNLKSLIISQKNSLNKRKKEYETNLLKLPKKELNLINLTRKHEINSKMYAYLLGKKSENDIIKVATISDYKVIEQAYPSLTPIKPKKSLIILLSLILGSVVGMIIAIIHNNLNKKIKNIEDIERNTSLEIYGMIPLKKQKVTKNNTRIEVFNKPQSNFSESFRQLRSDLEFASKNQQSNVILITSIASKEGKSTILANLSAIFQLAGSKSIIIDLNLRQPSLNKYFEIEYNEGEGISSYLSGKSAMGNIIFPTAYENLDIIPAGQISTNPSELMFSNKIEIMIQKLKEEYDYIFIDSAPIGSFTDTLKLMKYADTNLIVFKIKQSKKSYIQKLERIIIKYNLKNIKLIINTINLKDKPEKYT